MKITRRGSAIIYSFKVYRRILQHDGDVWFASKFVLFGQDMGQKEAGQDMGQKRKVVHWPTKQF